MDVLTTRQAAEKLKCSPEAVKRRCQLGKIPGAFRGGHDWLIPAKAIEGMEIRPRNRKTRAEREEQGS